MESSSVALAKSHSSCSSGRPQTAALAKLCVTGPRGDCDFAPLPTEMRRLVRAEVSARSPSHLSCTMPLPRAFLKQAPPLQSVVDFA
eukprot:CAMPEP_0168490900 /NCGR_PEP_ID=MMETSP0228-20121227/69422_1 /TAXON_ID=133427 /ORGANISM="Protoceratium reticulatum, Strain CCCM 535 (=CCMP 1889)" /LENGTH=86 /DNA_ID=CAMNT_0008507627 /DNA_START=1 /DNA_END=261 /DNA_ORIENTATION=+